MIASLKRILFASITPVFEQRETVDGQAAWEAFQAGFKAKEQAEIERHGKVNEVREERMRLVHSALGLAASRSIPTEGREGPVVAA